jgi:hypothetical protein
VRIIASFGWDHKVSAKRGACLQLNDIAAGGAGESLFQIFPRMYHPNFSAGRSIFQRALYVLSWKLGGTVEILDAGLGGRLT